MTSVTQSALIILVVVTTWPWASFARKVQYQECNPKRNIKMMDVDNCDVQPCRVFHRTTIKMTTQLSSPINSSSAEWEIRAFVNGRPYGHPEPVSDACLFVNSTSPNAFSSSHRTPLNSDQFKSGPSTAYRQKSFLPMCPLFAGKIYRFSNVFYVHDQFPKVATTIQYLLRGDNDEMIACARLHILMSS